MRIVGGRHRGRRLAAPGGTAIRPSGDRLREALFNILLHGDFPDIAGAEVLDAFAGTGAFGLEALSRGAARATFIDRDVTWVRRNAAALGEGNVVTIEADALAPPPAPGPVDIAVLDPPYGQGLAGPALAALVQAGWIGPATCAIVEVERDEALDAAGFSTVSRRNYGAAQLLFLKGER
ncbi:MAG: 16S rRNA (guanine(966)-N(2))-methyltransferase RsmD [Defluviicoccus sp.]|nr:16S rRNA (guanine(966)-N(2))-methyltransferase RsmD [Defluviicoccus sp.]MDE0382575.1 16S rRNA (guanine(966)-N(2))-methyltransferase RsmD [Defluviicoccus sp.]